MRMPPRSPPTSITREYHCPLPRLPFFCKLIPRIITSAGTAILRERRRWADCSPIFAQRSYDGPHVPILRFYRTFGKLIHRIATSDGSHFGQKRPFCVRVNGGGGIPVRFSPTAITRSFHFPILRFTIIPYCWEINLPYRHFR